MLYLSRYTHLIWSSQVALVVKNPAANAGDVRNPGSIPGLGRSPEEGLGNPLQYSWLENPHGQRSLTGYSPWGSKESDIPSGANGKQPAWECRRHERRELDPQVGKILWKRKLEKYQLKLKRKKAIVTLEIRTD